MIRYLYWSFNDFLIIYGEFNYIIHDLLLKKEYIRYIKLNIFM